MQKYLQNEGMELKSEKAIKNRILDNAFIVCLLLSLNFGKFFQNMNQNHSYLVSFKVEYFLIKTCSYILLFDKLKIF